MQSSAGAAPANRQHAFSERKTNAMNSLSNRLSRLTAIALGVGGLALAAPSDNMEGRWAATLVQGGVSIPFRLDISGDGNKVVGTLYNGQDKETTTSATIHGGNVELNFEHYLTAIKATVKDGELDGKVVVYRRATMTRQSGVAETRRQR
jgi:hypothetical protein